MSQPRENREKATCKSSGERKWWQILFSKIILKNFVLSKLLNFSWNFFVGRVDSGEKIKKKSVNGTLKWFNSFQNKNKFEPHHYPKGNLCRSICSSKEFYCSCRDVSYSFMSICL